MSSSPWVDVASDAAARGIHEHMSVEAIVTPTGLPSVDKNIMLWGDCRGIPEGSLAIVGGASNAGKTQFALWLLRNAAESGQYAGMVSLDMKNRDAIARFQMGIVGRTLGIKNWRPSKWKSENVTTLTKELGSWNASHEGRVSIHQSRKRGLQDVMSCLRDGLAEGYTLFVVDHLQKVRVDGLATDPFARADVITETLDDFVDEHGVTVIGLSQLNRNASRETDRSPTMYDLWGGTSMEANSAIVILLDSSRYSRDERHPHLSKTWVLLEKNQMGPKRIQVPVEVNHAELSFREAMDHEVDSWPDRKKARR